MYDPTRIDKITVDVLIHTMNNLIEDNNQQTIGDLNECLQCKKDTCKDTFDDICTLVWFYPGFQVILLNNITTGYTLDTTLKLFNVLCESRAVVTEMLNFKFDHILHHFVTGQFEKTKLLVLDIFCAMFKTMNGAPVDLVNYSEVLPLILRAINLNDTRVKVKGTYALFLILSLSSLEMGSSDKSSTFSSNNTTGVYYKGLEYSIQTIDRFNAIDMVISPLVSYGISTRNPLLLKNVFRIYLKLCEKKNVKSKIVEEKVPDGLYNRNIQDILLCDFELNELYKKMVRLFDNIE